MKSCHLSIYPQKAFNDCSVKPYNHFMGIPGRDCDYQISQLKEDNESVLKRLGYYTKGYIVARDEETDLAIIKLDGFPETAREIDWNSTTPATNSGDIVYILGNPGGQDLWRWTLGEFLKDHGDFLHLQSDVFGGNSGGPVLNKQGTLIGIVARSDRHMNALAIPTRDINQLLSKSQLKHSRSRR